MLQLIKHLLAPPALASSPDKTTVADENGGYLARNLYFVLLTLLAVSLLTALFFSLNGGPRTALAVGLGCLPVLASLWLTRQGRVQWATLIVLVGVLGLAAYLSIRGDGLNDIAILLFPVAIMTASLLLTPRVVLLVAGMSILSMSLVVYTQFTGRARGPITSAGNLRNDLVVAIIIILVTTVIARLLAGSIRHSLWQARRNGQDLAESNRRLQAEIAEHWRTQEQLRESEGLYRSLIDVLPDGVAVTDLSNTITFASPALVSIYGGESPADAVGTNALDWVAHESREQVLQNIESLLQNKDHSSKEFLLLKKDGARFVGELNGALLTDARGAPKGIVTVHRDITERKQAEEALRVSEDVFSKLFHSSPDAILLTEVRSGRIINVNRSFELFSGYARDLLIGHPVLDFNMYAPGDRQRFVSVLEEQRGMRDMEFSLTNRAGKALRVSASAELIQIDHVEHVITILHDITERKKAESALRESEERYRLILENSMDAILLTAPDGAVLSANPSACAMFQRTEAEIVQIGRGGLIDRTDPRLPALLDERTRTGKARGELSMIRGDGSRFPAEVSSVVFRDSSGTLNTSMIVRDITERKERERELAAIAAVSAALRQAATREEMLPIIAAQISELLHAEGAMVGLRDPAAGDGVVVGATGPWTDNVGERISLNAGIVGRVFETREIHLTDDPSGELLLCLRQSIGSIHSAACAPLVAQNEIIGWICVGLRTSLNGKTSRILSSIADIAANAIHRATLHEQTQNDAADLALAYNTTLEGWAHALELRDQETEGHTRRVTQMTVDLAQAFGIRDAELEDIRRGTLLHDIGKMGIPDSILLKPGTLNEREWEIMKRHPEYAAELLAPIKYLSRAMEIPYCHHEKWDGTGYPRGIKGTQIPMAARIFAVVDVWDALCSNRPYRKAWPMEKAREYIRSQAGIHFDPQVVEKFLEIDQLAGLSGAETKAKEEQYLSSCGE